MLIYNSERIWVRAKCAVLSWISDISRHFIQRFKHQHCRNQRRFYCCFGQWTWWCRPRKAREHGYWWRQATWFLTQVSQSFWGDEAFIYDHSSAREGQDTAKLGLPWTYGLFNEPDVCFYGFCGHDCKCSTTRRGHPQASIGVSITFAWTRSNALRQLIEIALKNLFQCSVATAPFKL